MHLDHQAGHVRTRKRSASTKRLQQGAAADPGVRNFGAHIGQALAGRRGRRASTSARTGSASTRRSTTTRRWPRIEDVGRRLSRTLPQRPDLPERAHRGGARRARATRSSCASSARTSTSSAARRKQVEGATRRGRRRRRARTSSCRRTCRRCEVAVDLAKAASVRRQARRRAARRGHHRRRRGGRRHLPGRARRTTSRSGARRRRATASPTSASSRSTRPAAGTCGSASVADVRIEPTPNVIHRENGVAAHRRRRQRGGRTSAPWSSDVEQRLEEVDFPLAVPRRGARRVRRAAGRPAAPAVGSRSLAVIGVFLLLLASFRSSRLAMLGVPAPCPRRWWAACSRPTCGDGIISLGSLVGFFTVFGHRGAQRHHADQPLPASRASTKARRFGPELVLRGARERLSPILMTALATGLALVPLVVAGDDSRPRDRAPDGRRHPGRPGHLDAAQPVRRPVALPAVREEGISQPGDCRSGSLITRWPSPIHRLRRPTCPRRLPSPGARSPGCCSSRSWSCRGTSSGTRRWPRPGAR